LAIPPHLRRDALAQLLTEKPLLHDDPAHGRGSRRFLSLSDRSLAYLAASVSDKSITLETGNGLTTLLLTVIAGKHFSISPDKVVFDRVREFLRDHQWAVPPDGLVCICAGSEMVLPRESFPLLDLMLIDGNHGFPLPFLDWFYTSKLLRTGGIVIIDDCQLWTGNTLKDFLMKEPEWKPVFEDARKTYAFQKIAPTSLTKDWYQQAAVMAWSER
jgi:predicted O-methyltransferase YrrM